MKNTISIFKRELKGYFVTPVAYVFIAAFLILAGHYTFNEGNFFERGQADLLPFFFFLPRMFVFLIPAIAMRLWAEERKQGTIELLFTLPISMPQAVVGKFLAAWAFATIALLMTFPLWITVNYLGEPDNGVILASYLGGTLLAGGFLAIGSCISALTKNQVIAFVLSVLVCSAFTLTEDNVGALSNWLPSFAFDALLGASFWSHFRTILKGVIDFRDVIFFGSLIVFFLFTNALILDLKKAS